MKFEKIGGEQFIILEDNDKVCITTAGELGKSNVTIAENKDKINFSGDSTLVNSICGEGMLEKVYIPPVVSSEEIIDKCDKWIEQFKQVHDVFRKLVLSEKYKKQHIVMELSFSKFFSLSDRNRKGNSIDLDLIQYGTVIQEGMTISIDEKNDDIYAYLMANVVDYYLSTNYAGAPINYLDINWNRVLYSNPETPRGETIPMIAPLSTLYDSVDYSRIVTSLLGSHNLGVSADQIISNLRNRISNQQLSDRISESIDYSNRQYEYIVSDSAKEKQAILNKI
jgi:hypothetical protein